MIDKLAVVKSKIVDAEQAKHIVLAWRLTNQKIAFTNGCFDILHAGHVLSLAGAASFGNRLIVGVNSDASVKRIRKDENKPINKEQDRAEVLTYLECIDYVFIFNEDNPIEFIKKLKPNIHVKGGDYKNRLIVEEEAVKSYGGRIELIDFEEGYSTTSLIEKILTKN